MQIKIQLIEEDGKQAKFAARGVTVDVEPIELPQPLEAKLVELASKVDGIRKLVTGQ